MPVFWGYAFSFLATLVVIVGDYFIKLATDRGQPISSPPMLLGCFLYALSAYGWYFSMQHISLAQMGAFVFGEKPSAREMARIAFAVLAMLMMARAG